MVEILQRRGGGQDLGKLVKKNAPAIQNFIYLSGCKINHSQFKRKQI
jgi:hypothetical protein